MGLFEYIISKKYVENATAHLYKADTVKINLSFNSFTDRFLDDIENVPEEWKEENKWHNHNVRDINLSFFIGGRIAVLQFKDTEELCNWMANYDDKFKHGNIKSKIDFMSRTVEKYSNYKRGDFDIDEYTDAFSQKLNLSFCVSTKYSARESASHYQKLIYDDSRDNISIPKRRMQLEDSDEEADEDNINDDLKVANNFKRAHEELEQESSEYATDYSEGEGILKQNEQCISLFKKKFK